MSQTIQEPKEQLVTIGARHIFITEFGTGYPVLMLHGGGAGASGLSNYSKNIQALAAQYRVIVADMPGYGRSSKGVDQADPFGDLAQQMLQLLDHLDIAHCHIVGNSLGGACALRMALDAPARVSSLLLMGPGGVNTTRSLPTKGLKALLNYYNDGGPSKAKLTEFIREYLVYDGSQVSDELIEARYQASIDPEVIASPPLRGPKGIPTFSKIDFTRDDRLEQCQVPTLVLWGTEDKVNRPSGAEALQSRMPNCDVYLFSKTGHWVQWERAEAFNAVTLSFISLNTPS